MMGVLFLLCFFHLCCWTSAQERTFLITAPKVLRLDAAETVLVQLFGYDQDSTVKLYLKRTLASGDTVYTSETVKLNAGNKHQAAATLRIFSKDFPKNETNVYLHVSGDFNQYMKIPVTRENGFLFIQTDKPLYTPEQSVKVRVYSLNEELKPAHRPVTLTFMDPEAIKVDIIDMQDVSGIISMQPPFKIPLKPKLGLWKIEATYTDDFSTAARAEFTVKEYVLPSISVIFKPEINYISAGNFDSFKLTILARYVHGAPVEGSDVILRLGYTVHGENTVMIPNFWRSYMMENGELEVTLNIKNALSTMSEGPRELAEINGNFLYVVVLLQESSGGISQEAELTGVKFVESPFTLSLIATPPFIKPALPYPIRVLVKDPLGEPVSRVPVKARAIFTDVNGVQSPHNKPETTQTTLKDGVAYFTYNIPSDTVTTDFSFVTADVQLASTSQARLQLKTEAYKSINQRYLYIDLPSDTSVFTVNHYVNIRVYFYHRSYLPLKSFSYQIISKGKVVKFDTVQRSGDSNSQNINFLLTGDMVPSARLLVYYILSGEKKAELVADSVWLDVKDNCVNRLKVELSARNREYNPKDVLQLSVKAAANSLVALSSVDTALYSLISNKDPLARVLRHIEQSDQGCGGGGGKDNADVFSRAGLTFMTNANAQTGETTCSAAVRPKRSIEQTFIDKAKAYKHFSQCCAVGIKSNPTLETCDVRAHRLRVKHEACRKAFSECCSFGKTVRARLAGSTVSLQSRAATEFLIEMMPMVRSYFPESWLWEEHVIQDRSGLLTIPRTLPDSLTTWEMKAVGMSNDGICVSDPLRVSVTQKVSVDVPLPYSMVRGEQIELKGSVYNQNEESIKFSVTLAASEGVCVFRGMGMRTPDGQNRGEVDKHSVRLLRFFIMALDVGTHTLKFSLNTQRGREILVKTLRVVPEGIKTEINRGGTLDPHGIYGISTMRLELKNSLPPKLVPKSSVERLLTVNGEIFGEVLSIINKPEGLRKLTNLPRGSAEQELMGILPVYYVYHYLETTEKWGTMGQEVSTSRLELKRKMKDGLTSIMSFKRKPEHSFSMWKDRESSTWLTALVVKTLAEVDKYVTVDRTSLSNTIYWLTTACQNEDGSFKEESSYKPVKLMGAGADVTEQSAYLTAFVVIGIKNALTVPQCNLQSYADALKHAAMYLSQNTGRLKSLYVRAIAAYALTLVDRDSIPAVDLYEGLQRVAQVKGNPARVRFWQEKDSIEDPLKPNKVSAQTVETTVYVLLTALLRGHAQYAKPILTWLTQDQRYGGGIHSTQDTILTLEALTKYSILKKYGTLDMDVRASYRKKGDLQNIRLTQQKPVGRPIEVTLNDDVILTTGLGKGVSFANMKTVYYKMTENDDNCHFDTTIEIHPRKENSNDPMELSPRIVACAKYKPLENEVFTEAGHTVMEIHLPTGVQPFQEDLNMIQDGLESLISNYELKEDQVLLQLDSVPSDKLYCVGFRIQELFQTGMVSASLFKVYEYRDPDSQCSKLYYPQERKLLRLCAEDQCQCMAAECCNFNPNMDLSITSEQRKEDTCKDSIKYALKVKIESSMTEGEFVTYKAKVKDVFKTGTEDVKIDSEVEFVKKATCSKTDLVDGQQYLIMGAESMQIVVHQSYRYIFHLDSQAWVDLWPATDTCKGSPCTDYVRVLDEFAEKVLLFGC